MLFQRKWPPAARAMMSLSLGCAALTGLLVHDYTNKVAARDPGPLVPAVVATADIPAGQPVAGSITVANVPQRYVAPGALHLLTDATRAVALGPVSRGEIITQGRLTIGGPVAALVPSGLRALILPSGLPPGTVQVGDRVDILATHTQGAFYTDTVAEQVQILRIIAPTATSSFDAQGASSGDRLAVLLDPTTAEQVAQAVTTAKITIAVDPASEAGASPIIEGGG